MVSADGKDGSGIELGAGDTGCRESGDVRSVDAPFFVGGM
jgi:hypothetical protein